MAIQLADLLDEKYVALELRARTQAEALREIADLLRVDKQIRHPEKFLAEVLARETANSTLTEHDVAFPHARTDSVEQIVLAIGRSRDGIPWIDNGERARLIFLVGVPQKLLQDYLIVIGAIARITKDDALRTLLIHAENAAEFIETMLAAPSL